MRGNIQSGCFLILSVTDSPAICRRWMASLSGFPFRLTPLMARTLSPMWMAPVLQGKESTDRKYQFILDSAERHAGKPVGLPARRLGRTQRHFLLYKRRDSHCSASCLLEKNSFQIGHHWSRSPCSLIYSGNISFRFHPDPPGCHHTVHSPLCQAFLGEARDDNGVKRLLSARNGDAQGSVIPFQLHGVDYGAWHFQLIFIIGIKRSKADQNRF